MPKLPKGKTYLYVLIDKKVVDDLRELVKMKYDTMHGALSWEVEQALRAWLATHTESTQALAKRVNPQPKVVVVWEQVKEYLRKVYGYAGFVAGVQIPKDLLVKAIGAVRGSDPRTIRSWLEAFQRYGLVKQISFKVYEVV